MRRLFLDGAQLVTLVGPEGIGKTRLAQEFAREYGSVALVDDARAQDVGDAPAIATARRPLGLAGERIYPLKPLAEAPAVELFRQLAPGDERAYAELAAIVRGLGRLPAAIERAAAESSRTAPEGRAS